MPRAAPRSAYVQRLRVAVGLPSASPRSQSINAARTRRDSDTTRRPPVPRPRGAVPHDTASAICAAAAPAAAAGAPLPSRSGRARDTQAHTSHRGPTNLPLTVECQCRGWSHPSTFPCASTAALYGSRVAHSPCPRPPPVIAAQPPAPCPARPKSRAALTPVGGARPRPSPWQLRHVSLQVSAGAHRERQHPLFVVHLAREQRRGGV